MYQWCLMALTILLFSILMVLIIDVLFLQLAKLKLYIYIYIYIIYIKKLWFEWKGELKDRKNFNFFLSHYKSE